MLVCNVFAPVSKTKEYQQTIKVISLHYSFFASIPFGDLRPFPFILGTPGTRMITTLFYTPTGSPQRLNQTLGNVKDFCYKNRLPRSETVSPTTKNKIKGC